MAQSKRSPMVMEVVKGIVFVLVGIMLIVQPWLKAIAWLGWVIVVAGALIASVMLLRIHNAKRMQEHLIAQFDSGDAVYANGLRAGGYLYDFSTFGAMISQARIAENELQIKYSYYAKKRGRSSDLVVIPFAENELDKAKMVLEHLGVPELTDESDESAGQPPLPSPEENRKEV